LQGLKTKDVRHAARVEALGPMIEKAFILWLAEFRACALIHERPTVMTHICLSDVLTLIDFSLGGSRQNCR